MVYLCSLLLAESYMYAPEPECGSCLLNVGRLVLGRVVLGRVVFGASCPLCVFWGVSMVPASGS